MTTNPWDAKEASLLALDESPDPIYLAIGKALTAWEFIEHDLAFVFVALCSEPGEWLPAKRAYGTIIAFSGRAEMLRSAAEAYFYKRPNHPLKDRLFAALAEIGKFSARRNEIAHGVVSTPIWLTVSDPAEHLTAEESIVRGIERARPRYALMPSAYATNKHTLAEPDEHGDPKFSRKYLYTAAIVLEYEGEFKRLRRALSRIVSDWFLLDDGERFVPRT